MYIQISRNGQKDKQKQNSVAVNNMNENLQGENQIL